MKLRVVSFLAAAAAALLLPQAAMAAKWETIATSGKDRIELDRSRIILHKEGGATAWSRLARNGIYIDDIGLRYTAVEAFNRYDCEHGSFATLKRIWRRDGQLVREEVVSAPQELSAEAGTPDAKILADVCRQRGSAVANGNGKPGVMHADMRSAGDATKGKTVPVADEHVTDKKIAPEKPAGEKPRFIELPKIDKSQLEDPHKSPPAKDGKDAKAVKPAEPAKAAATPNDMREVAKAAAGAAASVSRQEIEHLYATSGPRRAKKKKPAKPVEVAPEPAVEHKQIHWSYEGEGGPANWAKLESKYATCGTGKRQSPIDIRDGIKVDLEPIAFDYKWSQFRIVDNGHTVQVDVGEGSTIRVMGHTYQLVQFHFHRPSEERIRGKTYDMVAHLVHKDDDGHLAVVAVLMEKGGTEHQLIQTLWNNMPLEVGQDVSPATAIDLNRLLPEKRDYYTYMGSLTTPPCTENVLWMVFKQPIIVSEQQVSIFSRLYKHNARPVQPTNDRLIKESR